MNNTSKLTLALFLLLSSCTAPPQETPGAPPVALPKPAEGTAGMVSSAHPIATEAGLTILKKGGNAFDAAVAVAATLNVTEPMMSGMGGYGTILIYDAAKDEIRYLDSSGRIPAGVNSDVFRPPTPGYEDNRRGPKAISTPGNVNAWEALSSQYGKLEWRELFSSAIETAETGYVIDNRIARFIASAFDSLPDHARAFYGTNGTPLKEGDRLVQEDLAASFRTLASEGSESFYGGSIGQRIAAEMKKQGSFLSLRDLVNDRAEWWDPIHVRYRGYEVYTASPPATAFPSLIRLGLMSRFDVRGMGHNTVDTLHHFSEVTKKAFWCRLEYAGDPETSPPPLDILLAEYFWQNEAAKLDPKAATRFVYPDGEEGNSDSHTTHFVVADQWGNIVSATQTLGNSFGSRIMAAGTGIWLNNSLAYCTFEPKGNPMDAHAGRRKLSGDCPTIILRNGKPWIALGTPGGHTIGQSVPQMVMNLIDFGMDIRSAISAPRVSFIEPDTIAIEEGISEEVVSGLQTLGHKTELLERPRALGNAHGLTIEYDRKGKPARFTGASDPRGAGLAKGI